MADKTVKVEEDIHAAMAEWCDKDGQNIGKYATKAIREKLVKDGVIKEKENKKVEYE